MVLGAFLPQVTVVSLEPACPELTVHVLPFHRGCQRAASRSQLGWAARMSSLILEPSFLGTICSPISQVLGGVRPEAGQWGRVDTKPSPAFSGHATLDQFSE